MQLYLEKNSKKIKEMSKSKDNVREQFVKNCVKSAEEKLISSGIDYGNSGTCVLCIFLYKNIAYICNFGSYMFF